MDSTITVTQLSLSPEVDLAEDSQYRLQKIESIKEEVAEDWDNINNPVPFFNEVPVYEMG